MYKTFVPQELKLLSDFCSGIVIARNYTLTSIDMFYILNIQGGKMKDTVKPDREAVARIFKAFCDPNRIRVLELLQAGEMCACKILEELNIGQPTLSHHMKILCEAGIVSARKEGKWSHYSLNPEGFSRASGILSSLCPLPVKNTVPVQECSCNKNK